MEWLQPQSCPSSPLPLPMPAVRMALALGWRRSFLLHPPSSMQGVHLQGRCCAQQLAPQAGCTGVPGPARHSAGGPPGLPHTQGLVMAYPGWGGHGTGFRGVCGHGGARAAWQCHRGLLTALPCQQALTKWCSWAAALPAGHAAAGPSSLPQSPTHAHVYKSNLTQTLHHCPLRPAIPACRCPGAA